MQACTHSQKADCRAGMISIFYFLSFFRSFFFSSNTNVIFCKTKQPVEMTPAPISCTKVQFVCSSFTNSLFYFKYFKRLLLGGRVSIRLVGCNTRSANHKNNNNKKTLRPKLILNQTINHCHDCRCAVSLSSSLLPTTLIWLDLLLIQTTQFI